MANEALRRGAEPGVEGAGREADYAIGLHLNQEVRRGEGEAQKAIPVSRSGRA